MTPTVFREGKYRFFFFSREEERMHIHVEGPEGEAMFWLEPIVALAINHGLAAKELSKLQKIVERERDALLKAWKKHFG